MNTTLMPRTGDRYRSLSQKARAITEDWVENEMYCPSCDCPSLERMPPGTRVVDFECRKCGEEYQCKSLSRPFGHRILDSAYGTMISAIETDTGPNFFLMHYSMDSWRVENMLLIPRHLISTSAIERRKALSPRARRAGWVGCNILLDRIPTYGRIHAVKDSVPIAPSQVREEWRRLIFLVDERPSSRGWFIDVLACIQALGKREFTLAEAYQFETRLSALHPENRNVRPKIRQQLQLLRDRGIVRFQARGAYELLLDKKADWSSEVLHETRLP